MLGEGGGGGHLLLCPEMAPGKKAEVLDIFIVSTNFPPRLREGFNDKLII